MRPDFSILKLTYLKHIVETKGLRHSVERVAQVVSRFSQGRKRFTQMISCLEKEFSNENIEITFCVSANLLERHRDLIEKLRALGHSIAAHGYHHTKMTNYSKDEQLEILKRAHRVFDDLGVSVNGFRCPYLNFNQDTIEALQLSPYLWTSHQLISRGNGYEQKIGRLRSMYNIVPVAEALSLPKFTGEILEIPITLPDDEILYERCRVRDIDQIHKAWLEVFEQTYQEGELFHLLFHPERFAYIKEAILKLIQQVKTMQPAVWTPSLDELTKWWRQRARIRWTVEPAPVGGWRVRIKGPREATVLLKVTELSSKTVPIYKDYASIPPFEETLAGRIYEAGSHKKYTIGISKTCPCAVEEFLTQEGFLVERADNPDSHSFFISGISNFSETDKRPLLKEIDHCREPLLRIWRWPYEARAAFTISSDVDSVVLSDFLGRILNF